MTIYLSYLTFTDQDDIVPMSGTDRIRTSGIVNTLAGNDIINASNEINNDDDIGFYSDRFAFHNSFSTLNTAEGNDSITGIVSQNIDYFFDHSGIHNDYGGKIDTGAGNDTITGIVQAGIYGNGIYNGIGTINTGDGNDSITGISQTGTGIVNQGGTIDTGDGQDTITGIGLLGIWLDKGSALDTGGGNDTIITSGINNSEATINTGNGEDSIIYQGGIFTNTGNVFLGESNDSIIAADTDFPNSFLYNYNLIETGDGDDIITSTGLIYNQGVINTGNGDDIITGTGTGNGIYNNGGAIITGDGNDSIIANGGFESAPNSSGAWFLGEGEDYIKGFGNGDFYGGNGNDTLELTPGTYTLGIWGEGGESPIFTKGDQLMITSQFEKLKAGGTIYDFTSLTAGQIIVVG
jgi:hypothetical protein